MLPEQSALKFGFPPTRRVVNFITKRRFRQIEVRGSLGTLTRGGSSTVEGQCRAHPAAQRCPADARARVPADRPGVPVRPATSLPDPDVPFDALGNVTGIDGGEIDPALSAVSRRGGDHRAGARGGRARRTTLPRLPRAANQPRLFDIGPYRTMTPRNDAFKAEAVLADRIGATLAGSLSLSAEQSRDRTARRPGDRAADRARGPMPYSPFAVPVVLNRYLTEVDPLAQHQTTTTLHAGVTLRGALAGWQWDFTGALDHQQVGGSSERQIDPAAAQVRRSPPAPIRSRRSTRRCSPCG